MNKPVGGRGKKAPYETQVVRVPVPIAPQVEQFIESYRLSVINSEDNDNEQTSEIPSEVTTVKAMEALQRAREIVKQKRSAAESLAKLLQVLYGGTVRKEDLK
jgi:hypothetical protein